MLLALALVAISGVLMCCCRSVAQEAPLFAEPKKDWAWDEDKRFDFLMERLAGVEASLDAVDSALAKASGRRGAALGRSRTAERGNEMMDRKGGGPMPWKEFYGTTAEKFFYHPVDPNTTYHTNTALQQMGNTQDDKVSSGVPSSQSVPTHQRPPQFDYIYRANREAKEKAEREALAMEGQIEALSQRKAELEKEQAMLWCLVAFRAIQRMDMPDKPLLRFQVIAASPDAKDVDKAKALAAAARFLATSLLIVQTAEADQNTAFGHLKGNMTNARKELNDALLQAESIADDRTDRMKPLGKYVALAKLLDDTSSNLTESYDVAMEGARAKDDARKDRFRGLLQRSLVEYAQIVLALDELLGVMTKDWKVTVDARTPATSLGVTWDSVPGSRPIVDPPQPITPTTALLKKKFSAPQVAFDEKKGVLTLTYNFATRNQLLKDFKLPDQDDLVAAGRGGLRIGASEAIIHVVEFKEGSISGRFTYGNRDGHQTLLGASATTVRLDRLVGGTADELRLQLWSEGQFLVHQDIGYTTPLSIKWDATETKVRVVVNGKELAGKRIVAKDVGRFGLYGGNGGLRVDAPLVISGKPKEGWLEGFLAE
jgi:hypothetical protein